MQVKPAISEGRAEDRRLFVGMLSKTCSENDVRAMFTTYGVVEDVSILRNPDGTSKGAAFVRLATKMQAQNAISAMHQCQTMPVRKMCLCGFDAAGKSRKWRGH